MGITYDSVLQRFVFDFEHDGAEDIVSLMGSGYQVEAFGKCFYYGYEFADNVDGPLRSAFIKYVKFSEPIQENPDLPKFIQKAVNHLSHQINLYDYNLVVMPESTSQVDKYLMRYIYRFAQPKMRKYEDILNYQADEELCSKIRQQNVLVIDDVATSGSTINEILRTLRILNEDNNIAIFSLIGRKDLMTDAN